MTWGSLVWKNLMRRRARTGLTALGVGLGVGLIIALLSITNGVHRTAEDLIHVGRADFGLFQGDVNDFTRSNLPESLAASVARDPAVAQVAKIKLLVDGGTLVFGLDPSEFAYRRLVVVRGRRGPVMAGDHSGKQVGQVVTVGKRRFRVSGVYHSGDRFEDLGLVVPLSVAQAAAGRPREITTIGVVVKLGSDVKAAARRLQARYPGVVAVTEPGQAVKVDTSSKLIISTGWLVSILALIVGGIGVTNTMAMSVFERVREIGILRALGWSRRRIAGLIVSEALGIGVIALAVGCAFGILAAELFVEHSALSTLITPAFTLGTFAWGLGFALGVGLLGAIYPTLRAVRLAPVAALRHE
ncbi:MAG TPA: FtsX-like permease family protein [Gaiellaceae bacterium]|nr:FtsX-like permease family protein [Gaiellaceae bacterium]